MKRFTAFLSLLAVMAVLGLSAIILTGCASTQITADMTSAQKADLVVSDIETGLATAQALYPAIVAAVSPDKAQEVTARVAPAMDAAVSAVAVVRLAVETWKATGDGIDTQDWVTIRSTAAQAVANVVVIIAELRSAYGV